MESGSGPPPPQDSGEHQQANEDIGGFTRVELDVGGHTGGDLTATVWLPLRSGRHWHRVAARGEQQADGEAIESVAGGFRKVAAGYHRDVEDGGFRNDQTSGRSPERNGASPTATRGKQ